MTHSTKGSDHGGTNTAEPSDSTAGLVLENPSDECSRKNDEPRVTKASHDDADAFALEATNGEKSSSDGKSGDDGKEDKNKTEHKVEAEEKSEPELLRTRIGRPDKNSKGDIIDQADWQTMVPKKDPESKFVIAVDKGDDDREQVTLYSPYIQKVFRAVIRYLCRLMCRESSSQ